MELNKKVIFALTPLFVIEQKFFLSFTKIKISTRAQCNKDLTV